MLNPAQTIFLHSLSLCFSWRKAGVIADAFNHHMDAVEDRKQERIEATRIGFRLAAGDSFGTSGEPVEGDSVISESIWDKHRAFALRTWIYMGKSQAMQSSNPEVFSAFLDSVSFMGRLSSFPEAAFTNRVVSNVYAGLLPSAEKRQKRDDRYDLMKDYVSGLRVVWEAAGAHQGHREGILSRLQMAMPEPGASWTVRQNTRQVSRFIDEVSPKAA